MCNKELRKKMHNKVSKNHFQIAPDNLESQKI